MEDDHCGTCGMRWTTKAEAWQPIRPNGCGCGRHADPLDNEKVHHGNGRHNYRAYTKAQSANRG